MDQRISPHAFFFSLLIALAILLGASILLPHERYYRFQAHDNVTTRKADWIYERLHFDPAAIDVALIGTSRMAGGLSGPLIEREYCRVTGRAIDVANLSIPVTGRNMHFLIAREAAQTKAPGLVVFEVNETEARKPHGGFIFLANARDVLGAPLFLNTNYFSDMARLPGRQAALFLQTILRRPAVTPRFDPSRYPGSHLDWTDVQIGIDGAVRLRDITRTRAQMERARSARLREAAPTFVLPPLLRDLEYRFSRRYLAQARKAVQSAGGRSATAFLPAYGDPDMTPALLAALSLDDPDIHLGGAPALDPALWLDATHFNAKGADLASRRFAAQLASAFPKLGRGACR